MLAEERKRVICEIVNKKKAVKVSELSKQLNITEATVRRDLDELQNEKKLRRTHGGAVTYYPAGAEYIISELAMEHIDEKRRIAKKAYEYIYDNDTILFDGASTVQELSRLVAEGDKKGLTVLTNSLSIVNILSAKKDISVICLGGRMIYRLNSFVGKMTEMCIKGIRVDKAFLGVNGIDLEYGYSISSFDEAATKEEMIKSSAQTFVLADHSKFGATYLAKYADIEGNVDYIITDDAAEGFDYSLLEDKVSVVYA